MRTFLKYSVSLLATYLLTWTGSYIYMMLSRGDGLDFDYYWEYFRLAWTFNGLEIPSFIWIFSIVGFVPLAVIVVITLQFLDRKKASRA